MWSQPGRGFPDFATRIQPTLAILMTFVVEPKAIAMPNPLDRISIDPQVCGGRPCIKGTRIWVSLVLDLLAQGMSEAELSAEYPQLTRDDILAAIAYGAEAARERIIPVPLEPAE